MNAATTLTDKATETPMEPAKKSHTKLFVTLGIVAAIIAALVVLPTGDWLRSALAWVDSLGVWAPIAFIAIYAVAVVFFIPGSVLTAAAGTIFGPLLGTVYVSIASVTGATLAFLIGRHLARGWVEKRIEGNETFASIDRAVADEGWKIVGLTRLSPIFPFTLLNYAYGVTRVRFSHYLLASWIGMLPGTALYVYIGSLGKAATEAGTKTTGEWIAYGVGLAATLAVTIFVTKIAKKALNKKIEATDADVEA